MAICYAVSTLASTPTRAHADLKFRVPEIITGKLRAFVVDSAGLHTSQGLFMDQTVEFVHGLMQEQLMHEQASSPLRSDSRAADQQYSVLCLVMSLDVSGI